MLYFQIRTKYGQSAIIKLLILNNLRDASNVMELVDWMTAMVFHQSYVTQRQSLFALINSFSIVFSFILISADNWLLLCIMTFCIVSVY